MYWALCLMSGTFAIIYQVVNKTHATTSTRKIFHVLAVIVYIPGLILEPTVLYLASGIVMCIFLMLEVKYLLILLEFFFKFSIVNICYCSF